MEKMPVYNPNNYDLSDPDWELVASEAISILDQFEITPQGGYPEGFDIEIGDDVDYVIEETGYNTHVKIYYPEGEGPFNFLYLIHGGAFYGGWLFLDEPYARQLVHDVGIAVVAPSYVLSPHFPFPAALYENYNALQHILTHLEDYNLKADKVVVGGGSAGGNISMALAQLIKQRKEFDVDYGVFYYPVLSMTSPAAGRFDGRTDVGRMPGGLIDLIHSLYQGDNAVDDPLFAPFHANMDDLPDFIMISGRTDGFNKEFRDFAARAMDEGHGDYIFMSYGETPHGFLEGDVDVEAARHSKYIVCAQLKRIFSS